MSAGVTATGIRGALGISLPAANAAKASEPCGVRDERTGAVVAGFETLAVVDAVLGLVMVVTAVATAGLLVVVRVVVLVVNAGGEDLDGVMVTPEDEKDGVLLLLLPINRYHLVVFSIVHLPLGLNLQESKYALDFGYQSSHHDVLG